GRHPGVDIGPNSDKTRTPIWSAAYGRVVDVQSIENYDLGRRIVIEHDVNGERFFSVYAHLAEIQVEVGTIVDENTRIGFMGNSPADWEMAVHLHFEVRTSLNVKLDASGNYASFPRGSES